MITSLIIGTLFFGIVGKREWDKNKHITVNSLMSSEDKNEAEETINTDLVELLNTVKADSNTLNKDINTDNWFECIDKQKMSVLQENDGVSINIHLPEYTKKSCKPKIADFMRCVSDWRKSLGYRSEITTELYVTYVDENDDVHVVTLPSSVCKGFEDDKDPKGVNRLYESLMIKYSDKHAKAEDALNNYLGCVKLKTLEVIIKVKFRNLGNTDLLNILNTSLEITRDDECLVTENVLFCSELGSFYDFNENDEVEDFELSFE